MLIDVHLLDTKTGERVVYQPDYEEDPPDVWSDYIWSEGNYSCDCNRGIFFERAGGNLSSDNDVPCGETRFTVERIVIRGTDRVIYADDRPA